MHHLALYNQFKAFIQLVHGMKVLQPSSASLSGLINGCYADSGCASSDDWSVLYMQAWMAKCIL